MLARNNIFCDKESASKIKLNQLRGQLPASRIKYKDAIEACRSMEYIELNVSQIARQFSLEGSNWGRQLRTHCFEKRLLRTSAKMAPRLDMQTEEYFL